MHCAIAYYESLLMLHAHIRAGSVVWPPLRYVVIIVVSTLLLPPCPYNITFLRYFDFFVYANWRRLASFKVTYHRDIVPSQQYIVAEFPHGVRRKGQRVSVHVPESQMRG